MFSYENSETFKNIYFEEHLKNTRRAAAFDSFIKFKKFINKLKQLSNYQFINTMEI